MDLIEQASNVGLVLEPCWGGFLLRYAASASGAWLCWIPKEEVPSVMAGYRTGIEAERQRAAERVAISLATRQRQREVATKRVA